MLGPCKSLVEETFAWAEETQLFTRIPTTHSAEVASLRLRATRRAVAGHARDNRLIQYLLLVALSLAEVTHVAR